MQIIRQAIAERRPILAGNQRATPTPKSLGHTETVGRDEFRRQRTLQISDRFKGRKIGAPAVRCVGDARDTDHALLVGQCPAHLPTI